MNLDEIRQLAAKINSDVSTLNVELGRYQPPTPPATPPSTAGLLLDVARGLTFKAGVGTDLDKLKAMFPAAAKQWDRAQGGWADPSSMLEVFPDGRFRVVLDRANWANIPNAAIPLARPVAAARISYGIEFLTGWHWGTSGKIPGLARHGGGRFPGGGNIGTKNFSACLAWANKDSKGTTVGLGPYVYGQHKPAVPDQWWGPDYADGTLRWGCPTIGGLDKGKHKIEIEHRPPGLVVFKVDGVVKWQQTMQLLGPGEPHQVTHCHFRIMYGGDNTSYWPPASVPQTVVEFSDFKVEEINA